MSLDFFLCKIPIPYDALYVYDAWSVLVKSYSKSIVATTHGIVLVVGPIIKVKIILSLKFKINLIFYLIKEFIKHSCLNFFYEIVYVNQI